jgi:DNA-binding response OmpR family regulator
MSQERILIVSSNLPYSALLKSRLQDMGYLVDNVFTSRDAFDYIESTWVDLIILSTEIQGETDSGGFMKALRRKRHLSSLPVVVYSDKLSFKDDFERYQIDGFFLKPFSLELLLENIKDILTKKILVLVSDRVAGEFIVGKLAEYDYQIDVLADVNKFYFNICTHRYKLIVMGSRVGVFSSEFLISDLRESGRNKSTPVIVYPASEYWRAEDSGDGGEKSLRQKCEKFGQCVFMDKGFSKRQFTDACRRLLNLK